MSQSGRRLKPRLRHALPLLIIVIGLYAVLPQVGHFRSSWHLLGQARLGWMLAAVAFTALTYLAAAATYCFLAFQPLSYGRTVIVEMAAMFINRLLPGGIGALGANFLYLRKSGHSSSQAGSLVAINNLLGFVGHMAVLSVTLLAYGGHLPKLASTARHSSNKVLIGAALLAVLLAAGALIFARKRAAAFIRDLGRQLAAFRQRPGRLAGALASSMVLTVCNVLSFFACALAVGLHLPFGVALLVFTLGVGTSTAVPTPGGLGAFEAGLVTGLVAYHVDSGLALAVALLYRFISYWLALAVGGLTFAYAEKRQLLG